MFWSAVHSGKKDVSICTVTQLMRFWSESTVKMIGRGGGQKSHFGLFTFSHEILKLLPQDTCDLTTDFILYVLNGENLTHY